MEIVAKLGCSRALFFGGQGKSLAAGIRSMSAACLVMYCGVLNMSGGVWQYLVVSDACVVVVLVSGGVCTCLAVTGGV